MKKSVELLSPVGNYDGFLGALNAGADAFYLGGDRFSARAYADNFTVDEICSVIRKAHFYNKKVYLTVNTLLKDCELDELYDYILPMYETGLDGVIIQDFGVFSFIKKHFPDMELHASTQMTITGVNSAKLLKEMGAVRIVPARELTLREITQIKQQTNLEIECFIHGAMCYCYSGQCLFSSILGGRSGNRGRCAQPCRLPYHIYENNKDLTGQVYPLSMKDMCTLSMLPELIEAGIDSFKIEGRMKKPEYAAGVTSIYRKYIDLYDQVGKQGYKIDSKDLDTIRNLYIRSEIQDGYYEKHNGKEMITLHNPGYHGSDENLLNLMKEKYIREPDKLPVSIDADLSVGNPLQVKISHSNDSVLISGALVQAAQNAPMELAQIEKQLRKNGNTNLTVASCHITKTGDVFVPVKALNQARRDAIELFENHIIEKNGFYAFGSRHIYPQENTESDSSFSDISVQNRPSIHREICISTLEQLKAVLNYDVSRIYIDCDLYIAQHELINQLMNQYHTCQFALALPYILRARDDHFLGTLLSLLSKRPDNLNSILVRNPEALFWVKNIFSEFDIIADAGLYAFNSESVRFLSSYCNDVFLPYELNYKEALHIVHHADSLPINIGMIVYGHIPMMITANCLRKTGSSCRQNNYSSDWTLQAELSNSNTTQIQLKDRYGTIFPVVTNCNHCYNVIYNSVPYSLHLKQKEVDKISPIMVRYDFLNESVDEIRMVFEQNLCPGKEYTTGHLKRGVE